MTKKTLDERAEEVRDAVCTADVRGWPAGRCPLPEVVAAYEAEREARLALEARVRELLDAHAKLLDRLETAKARVRELEAERAGLVTAEAYGQATAALAEDLAATRAQLERLREAALMLSDRVRAEGGHGHRVHELSDRVLDALSTPGPTLAEIRRSAQVEVLRRLARAAEQLVSCDICGVLDDVDDDHGDDEIGHVKRDPDPTEVANWLSACADDLEAGRG